MTFKKTALRLSMLAIAATSLLSANAFADTLNVNLDTALQTSTIGSTVNFSGMLTNTTGSTVNLNSIGETLQAPAGFSIDDSPFYNTFPFTLSTNGSTSGLLFSVNVPLAATTGQYAGVVSIYGGSDGSSDDLLGSAAFEVDIPNSTPSPVPEPSSLILLMGALPGLGLIMRRKLAWNRA